MPFRPPRFGVKPKPAPDARRVTADSWRGSAGARGYGGRWRTARAGWLRKHPLCVRCLAKTPPLVRQATVVDHIQPHRGDEALFWDSENNWQSLCAPCHNEKTATEDGGFGNERKHR